MTESDSSSISLRAHPDTPSQAVRRITARAQLAHPHTLRLEYLLEADEERLRIPPPAVEARRADKLWAHTCFEAFVRLDGLPQYLELNFSPSGQWAAYRFESYRQGMLPAALEADPRVMVRRSADELELQAEVPLGASLLPGEPGEGASADGWLRIALSAVVEDSEGRLSYWSLRHPPGKPDFHHPDGSSVALVFPLRHPPGPRNDTPRTP